jgi:hypothetical protein
MSPDFNKKWSHILEDVDKRAIPIEFIRKLVIKLEKRKQHTINIEKMLKQGLEPEDVEDTVSTKLLELDDQVVSIEFVLNVDTIAEIVQPETDKLLNGL